MTHPAVAAAAAAFSVAAAAGCAPAVSDPAPAAAPATTTTTSTAPAAAPVAPTPPPPTPAAPPTGWPQTLTIPKLNITAPIVAECTINPAGAVEPPPDIHAVCATGRGDINPDGTGTTTLTGHTTRADTTTGALERINQLTTGDTFTVADRAWRVTETGTWLATDLPARFFTGDERRLILGTCHLDAAVKAGAPYRETDLAVAVPA